MYDNIEVYEIIHDNDKDVQCTCYAWYDTYVIWVDIKSTYM